MYPLKALGNLITHFLPLRQYVQFSSVTQLCPTLCNPMDCRMPGLLVHHQLLEFTQTHVHWVSDAIQPSHPLSSPFPSAFNLSVNKKNKLDIPVSYGSKCRSFTLRWMIWKSFKMIRRSVLTLLIVTSDLVLSNLQQTPLSVNRPMWITSYLEIKFTFME